MRPIGERQAPGSLVRRGKQINNEDQVGQQMTIPKGKQANSQWPSRVINGDPRRQAKESEVFMT